MNLSDTDLVLLSAAAQRDDQLLTRREGLTTKAIEKLSARLSRLGFVEEIHVSPDQPLWYDHAGGRVGLRISTAGLAAIGIEAGEGDHAPDGAGPQSAPATRAGTKKARVLEMLRREAGASLDELIEATGWLPHTTRAALTGLRKAGHELAKSKDGEGRTIYRLGTLQPAAE
jgi:hypothetical protein